MHLIKLPKKYHTCQSNTRSYQSDSFILPDKVAIIMYQEMTRKKEGFEGQKAIIIPRKILTARCAKNDVVGTLYVTKIGYYPKAKFHYRERTHGTDQHILIYCLEGSGNAQIGKEKFSVQSGDFFVVPAKVPHVYAADANNPWTIFWVHFKGITSGAIVSAIREQMGSYKGFLQYNVKSLELFNEIYHQLERGYSSDNLMYSNMCLWHFLTTFLFNKKYNPSGDFQDETDKAIDFLRSKLDETLSLDKIAASVNLSPSHFSFLFKKKTGFSPIEYFNHLKVQKACQYLLFTGMRIKEIASEIGIDDPYYFSRMFTKVMGMSPSEYKEKKIQ